MTKLIYMSISLAFSCCGPFKNPAVSTEILIIMKVDIIKIYGFVLIINQSLSILLMGFHSLNLEAMIPLIHQ